jgi:hypothetical protein
LRRVAHWSVFGDIDYQLNHMNVVGEFFGLMGIGTAAASARWSIAAMPTRGGGQCREAGALGEPGRRRAG